MLKKIWNCESGGYATVFAVALLPLLFSVGFAVDFTRMVNTQNEMQDAADAAALHAATLKNVTDQQRTNAANQLFLSNSSAADSMSSLSFVVQKTSATRVVVTAHGSIPPVFMQIGGYPKLDVGVVSEVEITNASPACILVKANTAQALLLNSGATIDAPTCEIHVHSQANPAIIKNAGININVEKLCVKGTNIISNGGALASIETGCTPVDDPYFGNLNEPVLPTTCSTSGALSSGTYTLTPGMHCGTTFNGIAHVTFTPGLHIIRDQMILNAGSTVIADDVTFYFPTTDSEIRANGGLTFKATAPKTGTYKDILMFEKTSDAANNTQKRQYIFNGSVNEHLEGIIYLPNRDVVYNSTTNVTDSEINIVANTMIINSANWAFKPYKGGIGGGSGGKPRLVN
jgi:Flp pilus assembly protein TadG